MKVYRAKDKEGEFWRSRHGRSVFITVGALKSAYSTSTRWPNRHTFDKQKEYEIIEYELVESKRYDELTKFYDEHKDY